MAAGAVTTRMAPATAAGRPATEVSHRRSVHRSIVPGLAAMGDPFVRLDRLVYGRFLGERRSEGG